MSSITITHDEEQQTFTWRVENMDGIDVLGLMVDVLVDMNSEYNDVVGLGEVPEEGQICVKMHEGKVWVSYGPETLQPLEVQGMLVTALIGFIKRKREQDFDPYEALLGALLVSR